jgi:hypothetical protein
LPVDRQWVAFITDSGEIQEVRAGERLFAPLASTRLRVLIPAAELARHVPVYLVPLSRALRGSTAAAIGAPSAVVMAKLAVGRVATMKRELRPLLDWLAELAHSTPVFADLSDDYEALSETFGEPYLAEYQRWLAEHCALIVPCDALREVLAHRARRGVVMIEDPYETPVARPVRTTASAPLRLVWFGNLGAPNRDLVMREVRGLAAATVDREVRLEVVAGESSRVMAAQIAEAAGAEHSGFVVTFTSWSIAATQDALERSDFVVLPQEHASAWGRVKSHNRLVEAIRAGRLAIASPIPSYLELQDYAWVGAPTSSGLRWALDHPDEAARRVAAGQAYVDMRFSPQTVGEKWAAALGIT